jgi:hypothetical protein
MERIEFLQERDLGGVISATFDFVRQNAKPLFYALVIIVVPFAFASAGLDYLLKESVNASDRRGFNTLTILVSAFGNLLLMTVCFAFVRQYRAEDSTEFQDVWAESKDILGSVFRTNLGIGVLLLILVLSVALIVTILGLPSNPFAFGFVLFQFGMLFILLATVLIYHVLLLLHPIHLEEENGFIEGLRRLRYLLTDHFWQTIGIFLILLLIEIILRVFLALPSLALAGLKNYLPTEFLTILKPFASAITNAGSIFQVFVYIGIYFQYFNLLERKEGQGLSERIEGIV